MKPPTAIKIVNEHIVTVGDDGGLLVIDTGSPISMDSASMPGELLELMLAHVSPEISGIVGMDVLGANDITIDTFQNTLQFGAMPVQEEEIQLPLGLHALGAPMTDLHVSGRELEFLVDTGAPIGYINSTILEGETAIGERVDFWPAEGTETFTTPVFRLRIETRDRPVHVDFAPRRPIMTQRDINILGNEIFQHYRITFCWELGVMRLLAHGN